MKATLFALFVALLMVGCGESSQPSESADMIDTAPESPNPSESVNTTDSAPEKDAIETAVDWSKLQEGLTAYFYPAGGGPFSGYAKETYENGQVKKLVQFKNGKEDGPATYWNENGQKASEVNYKDGEPDGLWTEWNKDGTERFRHTFKDGKEDGLSTGWYENGQKEYERTYKDGKQDGLSTGWYESGQKKRELNWKNDKVMSAEVWKPNGEKCPVTNLKDGNGVGVGYKEDGTEWYRITYKDGEQVED